MTGEKARAHIFVTGKVQGVFFRWETQKAAQALWVQGWVRNLSDGRVEIVVEGEKEKVEELVAWAGRGPILAKVENVKVDWEDFKDEFKKFEIID